METEEKERILRDMIRHEDGLRDHRLSYLLTLNGFLFAALAFAWRRPGDEATALVALLAVVGFAVGCSAMAAQNISNHAVQKLRRRARRNPDPPVVGITSEETKGEEGHIAWFVDLLAPWKALPVILIVIWPIIAIVRWRVV
jgi:hypothetical protein